MLARATPAKEGTNSSQLGPSFDRRRVGAHNCLGPCLGISTLQRERRAGDARQEPGSHDEQVLQQVLG